MKFKLLIFLFICASAMASSRSKPRAQYQHTHLPTISVTIDDRFYHPKKTNFYIRESFDKPYDGAIEYESTLIIQDRKLKSRIIETTYYAYPTGTNFHIIRRCIERIPQERTNRMLAAWIKAFVRHEHINKLYKKNHGTSNMQRVTSWSIDDPKKPIIMISHSNNEVRDAEENSNAYRLLAEAEPSERMQARYEMYRRIEQYAVRKKLNIDFEVTTKWRSAEKEQRDNALKLQKSYR